MSAVLSSRLPSCLMGLAKTPPPPMAGALLSVSSAVRFLSSGLVCYLGLTPVLSVFCSESSSYPSILRGTYFLYFCLELCVSGFKLRSSIRCELIFVQEEKYEPDFFLGGSLVFPASFVE